MNDTNTEALRRITALLLCSAVTAGVPCAAGAQTTEQTVYYGAAELPDSEELFAGYVDNLFTSSSERAKLPHASGRKQFDSATQVFYDELSEKIRLVADGEITDTEFSFDVSYLNEKYGLTAQELKEFDIKLLLAALLEDHPYELYWFDKTTSIKSTSSILKYKFEFFVSADYSESGTAKTKKTNPEKMSAAANAKKNALAVLDNVQPNWSDYRTLRYFKDKISELVNYDYDSAANVATVNYGDPWQMIYVFDGDKETNVVCEGYSKAFKFLCDNYNFNSDIKCDLMTGQMTSINSSGGHMWNNVTIGDTVYIADVTNSDTSSIGAAEELFIKGVPESGRLYDTSGNFAGMEIKVGKSKVTYVYDETTFKLFTAPERDVSLTSPKLHNVEWRDKRENVIETDELVADGERPEYNGELPVSVWQPAIDETTVISGSDDTIVYTEHTDENKYTVTFVDPLDDEEHTQVFFEGDVFETPDDPTVSGMNFEGWYLDEEFSEPYVFGSAISADTNIYAYYTATIKWFGADGSELYTDNYPMGSVPEYRGETPVKASDDAYNYTFSGWSPEVVPAMGYAAYEAVFDKTPRTYTITWKDHDGTVLETADTPYGETPTYGGETPNKNSTDEYSYTFGGWTPEVEPVKGEAAYTAVFEQKTNEYKITWQNYDGTVLLTENVFFGELPVYTANTPERPADGDIVYTFTGWDKTPSAVTGDCTYTAVYESKKTERSTPDDPTPVKPTPDEPKETPDSTRVCGDINNDGMVDSTDALGILRISVGIDEVSDTERQYCDTNDDNAVDSSDALTALRFSVGLKDNDRVGSIV